MTYTLIIKPKGMDIIHEVSEWPTIEDAKHRADEDAEVTLSWPPHFWDGQMVAYNDEDGFQECYIIIRHIFRE